MELGYFVSDTEKHFIKKMLLSMREFSPETYYHTLHTADICSIVCTELDVPLDLRRKLYVAALLHDCGKLKIDRDLLHAPKITEEEKLIIQEHAVFSYELIKDTFSSDVCEIVRDHHERPNGTGYPRAKTGDKISKLAKLLSVCDVTSALILPRSYKPSLSKVAVEDILIKKAQNGELDAKLVEVVIENYVESYDFNQKYNIETGYKKPAFNVHSSSAEMQLDQRQIG